MSLFPLKVETKEKVVMEEEDEEWDVPLFSFGVEAKEKVIVVMEEEDEKRDVQKNFL